MTNHLSLNGVWSLTWAEGSHLVHPGHLTGPSLRGRGLLPAAVPAPIHQVLMDAGLVDDPNVGLNSLKARWVEEMFWVYRHTFTVPAEAVGQFAWLTFARLELEATVWLNGEEIGTHANAHRPATFNVSGKLRAGENLIVVQLSTGMHSASELPAANFSSGDIGRLTKRHWHRHPQYQSGWDWSTRLVNVGILGDVTLEWQPGLRLGQTAVFAVPSADLSNAVLHVRAEVENPSGIRLAGALRARIVETGAEAELPLLLEPGVSRLEVTLDIDNPRLWWPVGHGEPFLYHVEIVLDAAGMTQTVTRRTGVRRVEIDQSPHPVEGKHFIIVVNNRRIFCKGGNWVPADLMYSAVPAERYRALVRLGVEANCNTMRIWGGGLFADHAFCDACDEMGVLIWHDFLFACAKYPGDDPAFAAEVRREVDWGTRELAHHPSLVVWCGNNEGEWGDWGWGYDDSAPTHPHYAIFHHDIPQIVLAENPAVFYWPSSPFSPDYKFPNDPTVGDQHPWTVSIGTPGGANWWDYRTMIDRFPNEGGVLGASSPATLRQFLPENELRLFSPSWEHHDNPFAAMDSAQGALGHAYQTVELWLGRDPLAMDWEEYAFASALLQAEGLSEYIHNFRRRMFSTSSAIFWNYNDSWPVTHGWTIVDYYLRKKLSYHPTRRAFQPVTVVVADDGEAITVYGVNDTPADWTGEVHCGFFTLAGGLPKDQTFAAHLPANASTPLASFPRAEWETLGLAQTGAFALLLHGGETVAQHRLFLARFKDLAFADPRITMAQDGGTLTLTADAFAWGVALDLDGDAPLADNCIDLLPGIPYTTPWPTDLGRPMIRRTGNALLIPASAGAR